MTSIAVAENRWILLKNETKSWLRESVSMTVGDWVDHRFHGLWLYRGHDALLQAIQTHRYTVNRGSTDGY